MKIIERIKNGAFLIAIPVYAAEIPDPFSKLGTDPCIIAQNVVNFILGLVLFVAVAFLAMGGVQYMQSAGDKMAVEQARGKITGAVVGALVGIGGAFILRLIIIVLQGSLPICQPTV